MNNKNITTSLFASFAPLRETLFSRRREGMDMQTTQHTIQQTITTVSLILSLLVLSGCGAKPGDILPTTPNKTATPTNPATTPPAASKVTVVTPQRKTLSRKTEQPGRVEPFEETDVVSKISGFIEKIHVEMGDRVTGPEYDAEGKLTKDGQLLAELTVPEMVEERHQKESLIKQADAEVEQSQAAVKVAQAMIDSAKSLEKEAQAGIKRAESTYDRWQSELSRMTALAAQSAVTTKVVDETRSQAKAADATRDEAKAKLDSVQAGVRESNAKLEKAKADQTAMQSKVKVAQADLQRVEAMLSYSKIRAPFDGVVSARHVHRGHLVQSAVGTAGKPLFTVTRIDKVRIFVDVPENDAQVAEQNHTVEIRIPAARNKIITADKLAQTAWSLDPTNRTLKVEIDVANESGELRPGMYVTASLTLAVRKDVLAIPTTAIMTDNGKNFCYSIESGKVARREIAVGLRVGGEAEIVSGLSGEERIVSVTPAILTVGQAVEVTPTTPPKP